MGEKTYRDDQLRLVNRRDVNLAFQRFVSSEHFAAGVRAVMRRPTLSERIRRLFRKAKP